MSIVASIDASDPDLLRRVELHINGIGIRWDTIPFVVVTWRECAEVGFAAEQWVIDLLRYAVTSEDARPHLHRIMGLLLGYDPSKIRRHDDYCAPHVFRVTG